MLGGLSNVSSQLSQLYSSNGQQLAQSLTRIASGKKIQSAADDFGGYIRANKISSDLAVFEIAKRDLANAKGMADYAAATGSAVVESLSKLKSIAEQHAATDDTDEQAALAAEFTAIKTALTTTIAEAKYDDTAVFAAATLTTVDLGPDSGSLEFTISAIPTIASALVTDAGSVQTAITGAATYLAEAQAFRSQVGDFQKLTDTVIASKQAERSVIEDVDDMSEMARVTDLQVRQQAAVSMMAQANMSRMGIMQLFV